MVSEHDLRTQSQISQPELTCANTLTPCAQFSEYPKKIIFPTDFWGTSFIDNPPAPTSPSGTFNAFISQLETFLQTTRTELSFTGLWNATKPTNVSATLQQLLTTTYADLITLDQTALVADPFIAAFSAAHGGQAPFVDPVPLARWAYGRGLPAGRKAEASANRTLFRDWVAREVLQADPTTCSDAILLYPQSSGSTAYRNDYLRCVASA